jgi:hypothetical protein
MRHFLFIAFVVAAASSMLPLAAEAAGLGPTKASQLFSAYTSGPCPIPGHTGASSFRLSKMVTSDGATIELVIPPKKVLVLTDAVATTGAVAAGNVLATSVIVGSASDGDIVAARFDTATTGGVGTASFTFPAGVAVRSGSIVCISMLNLTAAGFVGQTGFVHGYFASDK